MAILIQPLSFGASHDFFVRTRFTNAQVLALGTTPVTVAPAISGALLFPEFMMIRADTRLGGYVIGGSGNLVFGVAIDTPPSAFGSWSKYGLVQSSDVGNRISVSRYKVSGTLTGPPDYSGGVTDPAGAIFMWTDAAVTGGNAANFVEVTIRGSIFVV